MLKYSNHNPDPTLSIINSRYLHESTRNASRLVLDSAIWINDVIAEYISLGGSLPSLDASVDFPSLSFADPASVDVISSALNSLVNLGLVVPGSVVASDSLPLLSFVIPNTLSSLANLGLGGLGDSLSSSSDLSSSGPSLGVYSLSSSSPPELSHSCTSLSCCFPSSSYSLASFSGMSSSSSMAYLDLLVVVAELVVVL
jgi:hypothetical protein